MNPINHWLDRTLARAAKKCEDSDLKNFSHLVLRDTIRRAHRLATDHAISVPEPKVSRSEDEDSVLLNIEWTDEKADWSLYIGVLRTRGEKSLVTMGFDGETSYGCENPTDDEILKGLRDYFVEWKQGAHR